MQVPSRSHTPNNCSVGYTTRVKRKLKAHASKAKKAKHLSSCETIVDFNKGKMHGASDKRGKTVQGGK